MWIFTMNEPNRWVHLITAMNNFMAKHTILLYSMPILADVFVFAYPVYLVGLYLYGINKSSDFYKEAALYVFFAAMGSYMVNFVIKIFVEKTRPDVVLDLILENREWLLLEKIPTSTFPSDHMSVATAVATATLMRWLHHKNKFFKRIALPLYLFAMIMWIGRIMIGIHRPTDIIMGLLVGVLTPLIMFHKNIYQRLKKAVFQPLINVQNYLWKEMGL